MDVTRRMGPDGERTHGRLPRPGVRLRVLAAWHRWVGLGPWLVPLGALLTVWGLSVSVPTGAVGAGLVAIGVAASLWHPQLRRTRIRIRTPRPARSTRRRP